MLCLTGRGGMTAAHEDEDNLIPLSALQHFLFCPRQCALIHVERLWAENVATMEGRLLHEAVDAGASENRAGIRIARGVVLRSFALGVSGVADVVEFHGRAARPFPVEYKRGKPKSHRADEVQLCAQAICLEEMLQVEVPEGALYYGEKRRRTPMVFDQALRALTRQIATSARAMILEMRTPPAVHTRGCRRCSLEALCAPERMENPPQIESWLRRQLSLSLADSG